MTEPYAVPIHPSNLELRAVIADMIAEGALVGKTVDQIMLDVDCRDMKEAALARWHEQQDVHVRKQQQQQRQEQQECVALRRRDRQEQIEDAEVARRAQEQKRDKDARRRR